MDTFMNEDKVVQRLLKWYKLHGKLIIAYDFDDTVYQYSENCCFDNVIQLLKDIQPYAELIVYTSRRYEELKFVEYYLTENSIPFDYINENGTINHYGKKIYYNAFLDDKAGLKNVYDALIKFLNIIKGDWNG